MESADSICWKKSKDASNESYQARQFAQNPKIPLQTSRLQRVTCCLGNQIGRSIALTNAPINWNRDVALIIIITDVDDTLAPLYLPAQQEMICAIEDLIEEEKRFLLITGQGIQNVEQRTTSRIRQHRPSKHLLLQHMAIPSL